MLSQIGLSSFPSRFCLGLLLESCCGFRIVGGFTGSFGFSFRSGRVPAGIALPTMLSGKVEDVTILTRFVVEKTFGTQRPGIVLGVTPVISPKFPKMTIVVSQQITQSCLSISRVIRCCVHSRSQSDETTTIEQSWQEGVASLVEPGFNTGFEQLEKCCYSWEWMSNPS